MSVARYAVVATDRRQHAPIAAIGAHGSALIGQSMQRHWSGQNTSLDHYVREKTIMEPSMNDLECQDDGCGGCDCSGPVEMRWPGYGHRMYPRCEAHGAARLAREDAASRRYPVIAPSDFDPSFAGESWNGDD